MKTKYDSYANGELAKGCKLCVEGKKTVVLVTGLCSQQCYFCPLSERKKNKDVVYANEWPMENIDDPKEIIEEAKLCSARGAGITGGDPLLKLERTVKVIKMLKEHFGNNFHIHLYTPLELVEKERLQKLYDAGLDEIRFHPRLEDDSKWERITIAKELDWDTGVEIPVIPDKKKETIKLIDFIKEKVDFLNLNELEISSTNGEELEARGFNPKDDFSYGISGSEELALELLDYCNKIELRCHYCTTKLKDKVQLSNRLKLRAKGIARKFDKMTVEGMLIRGAIYVDELVPGSSYREKIKSADKEKIMPKLEELKQQIQSKFNIKDEMIVIDPLKLRILTSTGIAKRLCKKIKEKCAIVEEFPTYDQLEVEIEFLN